MKKHNKRGQVPKPLSLLNRPSTFLALKIVLGLLLIGAGYWLYVNGYFNSQADEELPKVTNQAKVTYQTGDDPTALTALSNTVITTITKDAPPPPSKDQPPPPAPPPPPPPPAGDTGTKDQTTKKLQFRLRLQRKDGSQKGEGVKLFINNGSEQVVTSADDGTIIVNKSDLDDNATYVLKVRVPGFKTFTFSKLGRELATSVDAPTAVPGDVAGNDGCIKLNDLVVVNNARKKDNATVNAIFGGKPGLADLVKMVKAFGCG